MNERVARCKNERERRHRFTIWRHVVCGRESGNRKTVGSDEELGEKWKKGPETIKQGLLSFYSARLCLGAGHEPFWIG